MLRLTITKQFTDCSLVKDYDWHVNLYLENQPHSSIQNYECTMKLIKSIADITRTALKSPFRCILCEVGHPVHCHRGGECKPAVHLVRWRSEKHHLEEKWRNAHTGLPHHYLWGASTDQPSREGGHGGVQLHCGHCRDFRDYPHPAHCPL